MQAKKEFVFQNQDLSSRIDSTGSYVKTIERVEFLGFIFIFVVVFRKDIGTI